mgnify:CR=1 FL=1
MNESTQTGILIAVITAIVTSILNYKVQSSLFKLQSKKDIRKEKLTKLLLPLYIQLKKEDFMFDAEIMNEDGDPAAFLADLPVYYSSLEDIIKDYLYLADNELTEKALNFIHWVNVAKYDPKRFDKVMITGTLELKDDALVEFKECVFKKYEEEKKLFLK